MTGISPERESTNVSTSADIRITFDHDMDPSSVNSHFHLREAADGRELHASGPPVPALASWDGRTVSFSHRLLKVATHYEAFLEGGFRDTSGQVNGEDHSWRFETEGPLQLTGHAPADGDSGVALDADLRFAFNRSIYGPSMADGIQIVPDLPLRILPSADGTRVTIAPRRLLEAGRRYEVTINTTAHDRDGNSLPQSQTFTFTTTTTPDLTHLLAFRARQLTTGDEGLWVIRPGLGGPRQVFSGDVQDFRWTGTGLLVETHGGAWHLVSLDGTDQALDLTADQVLPSPDGQWLAIRSAGSPERVLRRSDNRGATVTDADPGVVAWTADSTRLVYPLNSATGPELWSVDVALGAHFRLAPISGTPSQLAWSPRGDHLAELVSSRNGTRLHLAAPLIADSAALDVGPAGEFLGWTPDGLSAYFSLRSGDGQTEVRSAAVSGGSSARDLFAIDGALPRVQFSISDDGRELAYLDTDPDAHPTLTIRGPNGEHPHPLLDSAAGFAYELDLPAWRPAGAG